MRCHKNTHTLSQTCVRSTTRTTMSSDLPPMGIGPDLATRTLSARTNTPLVRRNKDLATRTLSARTNTPLAHTNKDLATRTLSARMSETVILIAWNGENCDLKWLWRITQAPRSRLSFPPQIQYCMDPYRVISSSKSCRINKSKSKLEGYDLGSVWKFINNGHNLNGAHNSLVDVKAQTDILINKMFIPFINMLGTPHSSPQSSPTSTCHKTSYLLPTTQNGVNRLRTITWAGQARIPLATQ